MSASAIERAVQLACIMSDAERDRALADPRVIAAREVADRCWRDFRDAFLHSDPADRLWLLEQTDRAAVRYATSFVQAAEQGLPPRQTRTVLRPVPNEPDPPAAA